MASRPPEDGAQRLPVHLWGLESRPEARNTDGIGRRRARRLERVDDGVALSRAPGAAAARGAGPALSAGSGRALRAAARAPGAPRSSGRAGPAAAARTVDVDGRALRRPRARGEE